MKVQIICILENLANLINFRSYSANFQIKRFLCGAKIRGFLSASSSEARASSDGVESVNKKKYSAKYSK